MALDSQSQSVVTTLVVGIVVGILLMGIMFLFRNNPIYSPKKHKKLIGTYLPFIIALFCCHSVYKLMSRLDGDVARNWVHLSDELTLDLVGMDAFVLLRFTRLMCTLTLITSVFALIILVGF